MPQRSSTSRYILTALAIILVITAFILIGLNALQLQSRLGGVPGLALVNQQTDQAYKDGYLAARAKYQALYPTPANTLQLTGIVTSVSSNTLQITQQSLDTDPKVDGIGDTRTITITSSTKIVEYVPTDPAQFAAEQQAFLSHASSSTQAPPSLNTAKAISLSDIKPGSRVTISSATDVRLAPTIAATMVILTPSPAPPSPATP